MKFLLTRKQWMLVALETLAVLFVFGVISGGFFLWRLLSGPVSMDFAKAYIEGALSDREAGLNVTMDKIVLYWPEVNGPFLLGFENSRITGKDGRLVASINEAALGLSKSRLLIGQIAPTALILKQPMLRVTRLEDNSFDIGLANDQPLMGPHRQGAVPADPLKQILGALTQPDSTDAPAILAHLRSFEIEEAKVIVDDRLLDMTWTVPRLSFTLNRKLAGLGCEAEIFFSQAQTMPPALKLNAMLNQPSGLINADVTLEYFDPELLGQRIPQLAFLKGVDGLLNAQMNLKMDENRKILAADLTALSDAGAFDIPEFSKTPVAYKNLGVVAKYDGESGALDITRGQVSLNDALDVAVNAALKNNNGVFDGAVRLEIEKLAQADLAKLWPESLKNEAAHDWAVHKISKGTFSNLYAQLDLEAGVTPEGLSATFIDNVIAGFDYSGMDINYRAPLKPITNAAGSAVFDMKAETLKVDVTSAMLMDMQIPKAEVMLRKIIEKGKGLAEIKLKLEGPLKSALMYVQDEPIHVKSPIDVANVKGVTALDVLITLPTHKNVKMEEVGITVAGSMNEVSLPKVVKALTLTGGPFAIGVENNKLSVSGEGALEGRPASLKYEEFLHSAGQAYSSRVDLAVSTSQVLREKMGIDLDLFLEGDVPITAVYTSYPDKTSEAVVKADLKPARLFIDPFDYEKPPGQDGEISFKAKLRQGALQSITDLKGSAPKFKLETTSLNFREQNGETELANGKISRFTLNDTVANLNFEIALNGFLKIAMNGPFLDLRPFLNNEKDKDKPYTAPPMQVSAKVDRMRTADGQHVDNARIYSYLNDEGRFNQMELDGDVGQGILYVRYKPDESGKRTFRLEATDAGATLKAFALYDKVIGGRIVIYGEPIQGIYDRNLKGRAEMTNFRVVKAPVLAQLLGLMSLTSVTQVLNNEGLSFTKLETKFDWLYRPKGSLLVAKDGRTSGNTVGLTFDGTFDNAEQYMDVQGTVIPLSGVNKIISSIPLVGEILTGGTGSLIAATYSMKGKGKDIQTFVNPLSVLAPGILRRILFEGEAPGAKEKPQ